ncbi:hypothetical protein [Spirosoma spitsbergense]|uniref:hypothetical protein n=1 Tax=Spirosoma spitsbergense TaxID=431554 RepID=UPI0003778796|nr:hypothetical protein [Spirosoma spitsbergense]
MTIDFDVLPVILGWIAVLFALYFLLYYKFLYSIIDPLFSWVFATSFASFLAIEVIPNTEDIVHFFGCQLFLWFGFVVAYRNFSFRDSVPVPSEQKFDFYDVSLLRWTTYTLLVLYIFSNIIIGYSKGFALLSDTPTESKIANFQQGFGIFRKINWSAGTFVGVSLVYLYLTKKNKSYLFLLMVVAFFSSLDGSKSALIKIAISSGLVLYHPAFASEKLVLKKFQRYLPVAIFASLGIAFTVLTKENGDLGGAFLGFIKRFLYSADSLLYYYQPVNIAYFEKYSSLDYISVVTNPILGFLRLQPYKEAIGNIMVDNLRMPGNNSSITVGPNAPFYIEGRIYFYYWASFPFSMLVGYIYASMRTYFFSLNRSSAFYFVYMASFLHLAGAILGDVNLAVTQSFDLFFFVVPTYIGISFFLTRKIKIRLNTKALKTSGL